MDRINVVIVGAAQQFHPNYTGSRPQRDATPSFSATDSARSARSARMRTAGGNVVRRAMRVLRRGPKRGWLRRRGARCPAAVRTQRSLRWRRGPSRRGGLRARGTYARSRPRALHGRGCRRGGASRLGRGLPVMRLALRGRGRGGAGRWRGFTCRPKATKNKRS